MEKIRILVADDIAETRTLIVRLLGMSERFEVVGEAENGQGVLDIVKTTQLDMVLMDINMPVLNGLEATRILGLEHPEILVVIMSVQSESEYLKKAMLCGAKEYIIKPFNFEVVTQTLEATYSEHHGRHGMALQKSEPEEDGLVMSFFSAKGGVGKTFVVSHLALLLSTASKKRVLLIDGDLQFGDISMVLGIKNHPNLAELHEDKKSLSYDLIKTYLIAANSNLDVLLPPSKPEQAEGIPKEFVDEVVKLCRGHYDYILIDLGVNYGDMTLLFLDLSQLIYLITVPTVNAIHHTKLCLEVMASLSYSAAKVKVILNQSYKGSGISIHEIEKVLGQPLYHEIPEDIGTVRDAINSGEPMGIHRGMIKSRLSKQLMSLTTSILKVRS